MKNIITILILAMGQIIHAQVVADFENFDLPLDSFLDGSDGSGGFSSGNVFLPNDYSMDFASWTGWAISSTLDDTTPGFLNQYSAITAQGANGSATYAVSFSFGPNIIKLEEGAMGNVVDGLFVTNGTYPYLSMRDGDAFAKRFGGVTGDDPDFFLLTIKKYTDGKLAEDSVDFYLADYRFMDNTQDYIVDEWTFVDLSSLGPVDSLSLSLSSSDVGMFGMNTPAYFCIDNISTAGNSTALNDHKDITLNLFPNPASSGMTIEGLPQQEFNYQILDNLGREMFLGSNNMLDNYIDVEDLRAGIYTLQILQGENRVTKMFIKN